jgi:hypothetical protein
LEEKIGAADFGVGGCCFTDGDVISEGFGSLNESASRDISILVSLIPETLDGDLGGLIAEV